MAAHVLTTTLILIIIQGILIQTIAREVSSPAHQERPNSASENGNRDSSLGEGNGAQGSEERSRPGIAIYPMNAPNTHDRNGNQRTEPQASEDDNNNGEENDDVYDFIDFVLLSMNQSHNTVQGTHTNGSIFHDLHYGDGFETTANSLASAEVKDQTTTSEPRDETSHTESSDLVSTHETESSTEQTTETTTTNTEVRSDQGTLPDRTDALSLSPFPSGGQMNLWPGNISGNATNETAQKFTFFDSSSRILVPGKDLIKEISSNPGPDVAQYLSKCGVFPACNLYELQTADIINKNANGYHEDFGPAFKDDPFIMQRFFEVVCDATSVSIVTAFAIILAVVIFLSNITIIAVTLRTKSLRKPHGYFKISLAVADLLTGAFVLSSMSSNMVRFIHYNQTDINQLLNMRKYEPNYSEAAFFGVCAVLSQVVTIYSVLMLSIDSFLSIRWPMQYRVGDLMTPKRSVVLIAIVWVFATAVSAFPLLAREYVQYGMSYSTFSFMPILHPLDPSISKEEAFMAQYIHVLLYALLVFGIPFIATWILTLMTAYHSRGMLKHMNVSRSKAKNASTKFGRLERDIQRTVAIVLVMLTITVLPIVTCLIIISVTVHSNPLCIEQSNVDFLFASYYILVCGSFLNVIVYNACHKEFRRATFDLLCDICTFLFGRCCPNYCDLRKVRATKSVRSKTSSSRTRGTTVSAENGKKTLGKDKMCSVSRNLKNQSNVPLGLPVNGDSEYHYYEKVGKNSESSGSESNSSSRTISSIDTSSSSSSSPKDRSPRSERSETSEAPLKIPAQRALSCSSVFVSSNPTLNRFTANAK